MTTEPAFNIYDLIIFDLLFINHNLATVLDIDAAR